MWSFIVLWFKNVSNYMHGMSLYRQKNWKGRWAEPKEILKATWGEFIEIFEELAQLKFWAAFLELWDVWHSILNFFFTLFLGGLMKTPYPYVIVYHLCPFTTWKHGSRQAEYGCIRSKGWHKDGKPIDHVCSG